MIDVEHIHTYVYDFPRKELSLFQRTSFLLAYRPIEVLIGFLTCFFWLVHLYKNLTYSHTYSHPMTILSHMQHIAQTLVFMD